MIFDMTSSTMWRGPLTPSSFPMWPTGAWSEEEFETVIRLAEEGIARDTHLPGLLKQWRVWALEACRAANRIEEARRTARDLVLAGDPEFLTTYRDLVPSDGWPAAREVRDAILLEFPRRPAMRDELQNAATPRRRDY